MFKNTSRQTFSAASIDIPHMSGVTQLLLPDALGTAHYCGQTRIWRNNTLRNILVEKIPTDGGSNLFFI